MRSRSRAAALGIGQRCAALTIAASGLLSRPSGGRPGPSAACECGPGGRRTGGRSGVGIGDEFKAGAAHGLGDRGLEEADDVPGRLRPGLGAGRGWPVRPASRRRRMSCLAVGGSSGVMWRSFPRGPAGCGTDAGSSCIPDGMRSSAGEVRAGVAWGEGCRRVRGGHAHRESARLLCGDARLGPRRVRRTRWASATSRRRPRGPTPPTPLRSARAVRHIGGQVVMRCRPPTGHGTGVRRCARYRTAQRTLRTPIAPLDLPAREASAGGCPVARRT